MARSELAGRHLQTYLVHSGSLAVGHIKCTIFCVYFCYVYYILPNKNILHATLCDTIEEC